jgi:hypothetical protein
MARELFEATEIDADVFETQARPPSAMPGSELSGPRSGPAWVLALQRQAGNQAVTSLLSPGTARGRTLQRKADGSQAEIQGRADAVAAEAEEAAEDRDEDEEPPQIDPAEKQAKKGEQQGNFAQPDKVSGPGAKVEQAAGDAKAEVQAPTQPVGQKQGGPKPAAAPEAGPAEAGAAAAAAATAQAQATLAVAEALPEPDTPEPVQPPEPVMPLDAGGAPLPVDPEADMLVGEVAGRVAQLRFGAHGLALDAVANRARSHALRAGLVDAGGQIDEAQGSIDTVKGHVEHRRTVVTEADTALAASEEKAEKVATEAPGIAEKAGEGQEQSKPMATESKDLASSAASQAPDDEEAAAKSNEQGGKLNDVSGSLGSIDTAIGQTGDRAKQLEADAAKAKADNVASKAKITETKGKLDETDAKLGDMTSQNQAAREQVAALADKPDELAAGATAQESDAAATLARSQEYETRLHAVQAAYGSELQAIPARAEPAAAAGAAPGERERVTATEGWARSVSGEEDPTEVERRDQAAKAEQKRQEELAVINEACGGDFSTLDAGQKAGLALQLTFSRTFGSLGETNWPKFGKDLLRGFIDPRVSLAGVLTGLGMIASGGLNLLSLEQWERDPLGNLLKSSADIATGVTIVLGSIAGLAIAVIAISAALILLSWGFLSPVFLPVITFCSSVAATVGPWAVTAAEVALVLNALVFIKNLVDAATATTAEELQKESAAMGEDVNAMGMAAMQIAGDHIGKAVGPRVAGALEGVQTRLASSGSLIGTVTAGNLADIGSAMAEGHARAAAWSGEAPPPVPEPAPAAEPPPVAESGAAPHEPGAAPPVHEPAPVAEPEPLTAAEPGAPAETVEPAVKEDVPPGVTESESPVTVGESEHELKLRGGPEGAEVWACSNVCGPLKGKIDAILPGVEEPNTRAQLQELRQAADVLESRVRAGEIPEPADRLAAVRELGDRLRAIGNADPAVGPMLDAPPDFSRIGAPTGEPQIISPGDVASLNLPEGQKVVYVVRDGVTGEILKVGETTAGAPMEARFGRYERAGARLEIDVKIEVRTVTLTEGQGVRGPESALRGQIDFGESGRLPWDNTPIEDLGPRLGRPGPGTPFEPLPGGSPLRKAGWTWNAEGELVPAGGEAPPTFRRANAPPPRAEIEAMIRDAGGDVDAAATAAGVERSTFYRWLRENGLSARDFR